MKKCLRELIENSIVYGLICHIVILIKYRAYLSPYANISLRSILNQKVVLSKDVKVERNVRISGHVIIGKGTYFSNGMTDISSEQSSIYIGNYCSIARNCFIRTSQHFMDRLTTSPALLTKLFGSEYVNSESLGDIVIEDDVWIGANVTVIGNVRIGRGAVIGACSLVNKDIKPYSIACGVPAKVIGYRFPEEMRDDLDKFRWEEYSDRELIASRHLFSTDLNDVKDSIWKLK